MRDCSHPRFGRFGLDSGDSVIREPFSFLRVIEGCGTWPHPSHSTFSIVSNSFFYFFCFCKAHKTKTQANYTIMFINTQEFYKSENGDVKDLLNGLTMVSKEDAPGRENWFGLSRHYYDPDTSYRVYEFGGVWYNFEDAWRDFYNSNVTDVVFQQMERIMLSLAEGWRYNPVFRFTMTYDPHGVRVTKSCRELAMMVLAGYELDEEVCNRDWERAWTTSWEGIQLRSGNTIDTFSVTSDDLDSLTTISELPEEIIGTTYDAPVDLTGSPGDAYEIPVDLTGDD